MRRRNKVVSIRMTDNEYEMLHRKAAESGQTIQAFMINSIQDSTIASADLIRAIDNLNHTFADNVRQLKGLATNVNQMAHVANGQNLLPTVEKLDQVNDEIIRYRKESEALWHSLRSYRSRQKITEG